MTLAAMCHAQACDRPRAEMAATSELRWAEVLRIVPVESIVGIRWEVHGGIRDQGIQ